MSERNSLEDRPPSPASGRPSSPRTPAAASCSWPARRCAAALDDAGLAPSDVDGMVTFTAETNPEIEIARNLGIGELTFFSRIHHGGGAACGTVQQAAMAVADGRRRRRRLLPGLQRALRPPLRHRRAGPAAVGHRRERPLLLVRAVRAAHPGAVGGHVRPPLHARVRRHQRGLRPGRRSPTASTPPPTRRRGSTSSRSRSRTTRTAAGSSSRCTCSTAARRATAPRRSSSPSLERARDLPQPAGGHRRPPPRASGDDQQMMTSYYRDDITGLPEMGLVARQLCEQAGHRPRRHPDRRALRPLHAVRAAASSRSSASAGGARPRTSSGTATSSSAAGCPINTHGGQLGEAYIHGMNGIAEGVRQVRGTSVNQVDGVEHVLVTAGTGVPTSGIVLRPDR